MMGGFVKGNMGALGIMLWIIAGIPYLFWLLWKYSRKGFFITVTTIVGLTVGYFVMSHNYHVDRCMNVESNVGDYWRAYSCREAYKNIYMYHLHGNEDSLPKGDKIVANGLMYLEKGCSFPLYNRTSKSCCEKLVGLYRANEYGIERDEAKSENIKKRM